MKSFLTIGLFVCTLFLVTFAAFAQTPPECLACPGNAPPPPADVSCGQSDCQFSCDACAKLAGPITIPAPARNVTIQEIVEAIAEFVAILSLPLAGIAFVWAGITFMTSGGEPGRITSAKRMFLWALVGTAIGVGAFAIVATIKTIAANKSLF